jgi:anti-sigma-K factor RskA
MNDDHKDDAIALFALGALDRDEARAVDEHAATCERCARLLADAEGTVTALTDLTVPAFEPPAELAARLAASARAARVLAPRRAPERSRNLRQFGTLAASIVLVATGLFGGSQIANDRATIASDDRAFAAIAVSHFAHATFTKQTADAPTVKALWGKAPQWIYVIVDSAGCACTIVARTASGERDLGTPEPRGATATLFVPDGKGVTGLEVRAGSRTLATSQRP